eukprot:1747891-Rhodomonas_salina.1
MREGWRDGGIEEGRKGEGGREVGRERRERESVSVCFGLSRGVSGRTCAVSDHACATGHTCA